MATVVSLTIDNSPTAMRIAIDLDDRTIRTWAGQVVSSLTLKRRDRFPVEVRFLRGGVVQELPSGATGCLGIKADKDFNGQFVASGLAWTKSGTGIAATYVFDLNLNTVQISALFAGVPTPSSVALMLEIEWAEGNIRTSSNTLPITLENDIIRGDEGIAEEGGPIYPLPGDLLTKSEYADLIDHPVDTNNPHAVTAAQVGLGNVDNTRDADKPVSLATQEALDAKAPALAPSKFRLDPTGGFQLFNPDTNSWHALLVRGSSGHEAIELSSAIP